MALSFFNESHRDKLGFFWSSSESSVAGHMRVAGPLLPQHSVTLLPHSAGTSLSSLPRRWDRPQLGVRTE